MSLARRRRTLQPLLTCVALGAMLGVTTVQADAETGRDVDEKEAEEDSVLEADYVNDAARLVHDGHHERALRVLADVDPKAPNVDAKRFYTLRAVAAMALSDYRSARRDFESALQAGPASPGIRLHLAQACHHLKEHACTLDALSKAGKEGENEPGVFLMKAEAEWQLGSSSSRLELKSRAIGTLEAGSRKFPREREFPRLRIFYLIELGLYAEAASASTAYLAAADVGEEDYVAIGEALRVARDFERAQAILERARLRFPENPKIVAQLAHAYLGAGHKLTAAMLFEEATRLDSKYALEAAELYKEGGLPLRATWMNARVLDVRAKSKQRLSLLVDAEDFEAVGAMSGELTRLGLLQDQNVRYALAYAFFKTGRFEQAEAQLRQISEPALLDSSLALRKAIESCRAAGWECAL